MIKIATSLILALGLMGSAFLISDGLYRMTPTNGLSLEDDTVLLFSGGRVRACILSDDTGLWICNPWSNP